MNEPFNCWTIATSADPQEAPVFVLLDGAVDIVNVDAVMGFAATLMTDMAPLPLVVSMFCEVPINPAPIVCAPETVPIAVNAPVESTM